MASGPLKNTLNVNLQTSRKVSGRCLINLQFRGLWCIRPLTAMSVKLSETEHAHSATRADETPSPTGVGRTTKENKCRLENPMQ